MSDGKVIQLRGGPGGASSSLYSGTNLHDIGGGGDGMDPWQTSVESRLGQLHADLSGMRSEIGGRLTSLDGKMDSNFKWLIGAYGAGMVIVISALIAGYLLLANKIDLLST